MVAIKWILFFFERTYHIFYFPTWKQKCWNKIEVLLKSNRRFIDQEMCVDRRIVNEHTPNKNIVTSSSSSPKRAQITNITHIGLNICQCRQLNSICEQIPCTCISTFACVQWMCWQYEESRHTIIINKQPIPICA